MLAAGGLKVYITIDPQLQALAERVVDNNLTAYLRKKRVYSPYPRKKDFPLPSRTRLARRKTELHTGSRFVANRINSTGAIRVAAGGRDQCAQPHVFPRTLLPAPGGFHLPAVCLCRALSIADLLPGTLVDDSRIEKGELLAKFRPIGLPEKFEMPNTKVPSPRGHRIAEIEKILMTVRIRRICRCYPAHEEIYMQDRDKRRHPRLLCPSSISERCESTLKKTMTTAYTVFSQPWQQMPTPT